MNDPLVSVIIPTLNSEEYIEDSLRSIINQSYDNIEIIVVDDGSVDSTIDIVSKFSKNNEKISLIERNTTGIASARNRGIRESKGDLIANQDADDVSHKNRIEIQVNELIKRDLDIIGCGTYDIDMNSNIIYHRNVLESINKNDLKDGFPVIHGTLLMKKRTIQSVDLYDERFPVAEDKDLIVRIVEKGYNIGNIDIPLYKFRKHETSTYASNLEEAKVYGQFSILKSDDKINNINLDNSDIGFEDIKQKMSKEDLNKYYIELAQENLRYNKPRLCREYVLKSLKLNYNNRAIGILGLSFVPQVLRDKFIKLYRLKFYNESIAEENRNN